MKFLSTDGFNLAYTDIGSGEPILLVHGFPLDSRVWSPVAQQLAGRYRVVSVDLPGFGQSQLGSGFTIESLADTLAKVMDQLQLGKVMLAGLSMGAYVGFAFADRHAAKLAGLALVDSKAAGDTPEQKQGRDRMIALVRSSGSKAIADDMLGKMTGEETIRTQPALVRELRNIMEACPPKTIETALAAMRDRKDYVDQLPKLPVPFAVIVGEGDVISPPSLAEQIAAAAPGAMLRKIPAAGHMAPFEQPTAVADALRAFAERCFNP
jgi:pimeloyl-ACP methyl ester carboxylesterase